MNVALQIYGSELKAVCFFMLASLCGMVPWIEGIPDIFNQSSNKVFFSLRKFRNDEVGAGRMVMF
ncbi:hypothetical protein JMN32_15880 [Fulvivirga sp. 29W222]|uniref:Uncharacterized protein n=1 Tax=Fulvivirga marina TaxID=2494733 RepID=A0A937KCV3_9BACT|nr:hypothetical protein [Fulvivirga marina]MBL6447799.1 hypothetical protein [Fulvivirga marina]